MPHRTLNKVSLLLLCVVPSTGCGVQSEFDSAPAATESEIRAGTAPLNDAYAQKGKSAGEGDADKKAVDPTRKIIYEAEITLVVDDVSKLEIEMTSLIKRLGGYLADVAVDRSQGEQLSGRWRVRIPVAQFESFLDAVSKFGIPESRRQTAQDVSEEFVDLNARISNQKRLEERIVKLLEDPSGEIKDVIEVERELARVRSEVEQMEGRLRYLTDRTDLTTVVVIAREEHDYVPPEAPTFASRIHQAWDSSLLALRNFAESVVVAAVAAAPWIVVAGTLLVPSVLLARRRRGAHRNHTAEVERQNRS